MNPRWTFALVVPALLAALTGCAGDTGEAGPKADGMTFTNPVYPKNFPDPGVLRVADIWYAYGTNDGTRNVPLISSRDLVHWTEPEEVLSQLGGWASVGHTWAPEVIEISPTRYVLYYTAKSTDTGLQCIGTAVADGPHGPFKDESDRPLICEADEGGSIDASPFRDADGKLYLYWKNDGNHIGTPTHLYGQRLSADGTKLKGERVRLLTNSAPWHGKVIEAPQMHLRQDRYHLFYSANAFDSDRYAVGYAVCDGPLGPCRDAPENPILKSTDFAAGPGHCSLVVGPDGKDWLLYHAWPPDALGSQDPGRTMWLDRVDWVDGKPVVRGPTHKPQAAP